MKLLKIKLSLLVLLSGCFVQGMDNQEKLPLETEKNKRDTSFIFLLKQAIRQDRPLDVLKFLVDNKADVNAIDETGDSVLKVAIVEGKPLNVVEFLIDNKADINKIENSILKQIILNEKEKKDYRGASTLIQFLINCKAVFDKHCLIENNIFIGSYKKAGRTINEQRLILTFLVCCHIFTQERKHLKIPKPILKHIFFELLKISVYNKKVIIKDIRSLSDEEKQLLYVSRVGIGSIFRSQYKN